MCLNLTVANLKGLQTLLPVFRVFAANSVAHSPVGFGPTGASLQHVSEVICSTGAAAAFLSHLIQNQKNIKQ